MTVNVLLRVLEGLFIVGRFKFDTADNMAIGGEDKCRDSQARTYCLPNLNSETSLETKVSRTLIVCSSLQCGQPTVTLFFHDLARDLKSEAMPVLMAKFVFGHRAINALTVNLPCYRRECYRTLSHRRLA